MIIEHPALLFGIIGGIGLLVVTAAWHIARWIDGHK